MYFHSTHSEFFLAKFLARTNYLPLNERLFKIDLDESSKCIICDDDIVEDLNHFLFECKTLRGIRRELFEEIETVITSFYPDIAFSELPPKKHMKVIVIKVITYYHRNKCDILHQNNIIYNVYFNCTPYEIKETQY
jgi:hypothetical protein